MSTSMKDGGPAFPRPCADVKITDRLNQPRYNAPQDGMSLRDYFAGQALVGMMANHALVDTFSNHAGIAAEAHFMADAMLVAREAKS